ncbi:MAG: hypothetical protein V1736_03750 [Pseudomonadota bacterium]
MTQAVDPELFSFAEDLLERNGGLVEQRDDHLSALLPASLAQVLDLPEEAQLGGEAAPLLYGSPILDRLVNLATGQVPVIYGQVEVRYLKKAGFEQLLGRDLVFTDGQVKVGPRAEARTTYMILSCHYIALSDERKEGLVQVAVNENSGASISGLAEGRLEFQNQFFSPGKVPPHFPVRVEQAIENAMQGAKVVVEAELRDFLSSMERRLQRDVKNTREYYEALAREMEDGLSHPNMTESQRQDRVAKIRDLPQETARKTQDLKQKYQVEVKLTACAAMRLLVDIAQIAFELRYRKLHRSVRTAWNPITRRLDPLVCENCRATISRIYPVIQGSDISLRCLACSRK